MKISNNTANSAFMNQNVTESGRQKEHNLEL